MILQFPRRFLAVGAVAAVVTAGTVAVVEAATTASTATCKITPSPSITTGTATETIRPTVTCSVPLPPPVTTTVTTTVTASGTTTSPTSTTTSPTSTTSTTTSPTTTTTSPAGWACTAPLGGGCGAYDDPNIPMSNGYDTYVSNQDVGAQTGTTQTVYANSPADWKLVANDVPYGYTGVQTFPDVQQLTNDWCGNGWQVAGHTCSSNTLTDTPLNSLSSLKINYTESSPQTTNSIYEFAADVWSDNYGSDVMFWTDTKGRCNEGAFGSTVLGHATFGGQNWTVHRYGGPGAEVIFILDGAGGTGTCAQQTSGTIDVKAGFDWLVAGGFASGPQVLSQVNSGWEITSADNTTFQMTNYSITASVA